MIRIGVDVGGTFTDLILADESSDKIYVNKVPSTVEDQSIGVINGIKKLSENSGIPLSDVDYVLHGTTVATNITIENDGAKVGMLTTRNYRDILHIARHKKSENFSIQQDLPWQTDPLVQRRNRLPITEKLAAPDGRVRTPLAEEEVRDAVARLKNADVDVVIVCFLFSFLNDEHEKRAKEIVNELWPEVRCFTSSEVVPQIREYERFSTTAMNAYVAPRVSQYLNNLVQSLEEAGARGKLHIMQSSGGMATTEKAMAAPMNLLKSGPAGGVLAAAWWGELDGIDDIISVDIGGTSADISVIPDGTPRIVNSRDAEVNEYPVITSMVDVETIGAGGGSVAYVDAGGAFRVGPKSAGATPGPACYGQGGEDPCVTDANVILGRLDAEQFLGGDLPLYPERSRKAIEPICKRFNMSPEEAAMGILKIINNHMALSIREKSVRKGIDPREFALFASGGAGPLHSVDLAKTINATVVIVPSYPGITSAAGLMASDLKYNFISSHLAKLNAPGVEAPAHEIHEDLLALDNEAQTQLISDGIKQENIEIEKIAECRYVGQGFELRVPIPDGPFTMETADEICKRFHEVHQQEYGHHFSDNEIELITLRVIATGKTPAFTLPKLETGERKNPKEAMMYERNTFFEVDGEIKSVSTPRYHRDQLLAYDRITGPALIIQRDSTTTIPPGWESIVSPYGTLLATPEGVKTGAAHNVDKQFSKVRG